MKARLLRVLCMCSALAVALPARPPSVTIGALFTFDSVIGSSAATAIRLAVDDINRDATLLRGTNLSVLVQDTKCSGFVGTIQGRHLICSVLISFFVLQTNKNLCLLVLIIFTDQVVGLYASETAVHTMSLSPLGRDLPFNLCHFFLLCSLFIFLLMLLFLEFAPSDPLFSTNGLPLTNQLIVRLHAFRAFTSHSDEQALFSFLSHSHVNLV